MAFLWIPLACGLVYALGIACMKRALELGADPLGANLVCNVAFGLATLPLLGRGGGHHHGPWWQPALIGGDFALGQVLALRAVRGGDVSIATPALGSKVLMVAALTVALLRQPVPPAWWLAAALSLGAVLLLQAGAGAGRHRHVFRTLMLSLAAAAVFSLNETLIQAWGSSWGTGGFLAALAWASAGFSLAAWPRLPAPRLRYPAAAWRWLGSAAALLAAQVASLSWAIATYGHVTAVNIAYSTRGLWSVALVWGAGGWLGNREGEAGRRRMAARLAGAGLLLAALALVAAPR